METLANRLKEKRTAKHLTQQKVADTLRVHQVTYQGYETGKHKPDVDTLIKLADLYDTSTDYLLGRRN